MFSVSTSVVLLVFFVSQAPGQTSVTVTPNVSTVESPGTVSATPNLSSVTLTTTWPITSSTTSPTTSNTTSPTTSGTNAPTGPPTGPPTKSSEQPTTLPSKKTCAKLGVVIDTPWNDIYKNNPYLTDAFSSALKTLYNDSEKYTNVNVSEVDFTEKEDKVSASAKLCLVFKKGVFIEEVYKKQVETGKLGTFLPVKNDSAEFDPQGVSFGDWKAKKGECEEKCDGAAGPFSIVQECEPEKGFSCDGLKEPTEKTDECTKYCPSTAVAVTVSSLTLVIGIFLSSSFQ